MCYESRTSSRAIDTVFPPPTPVGSAPLRAQVDVRYLLCEMKPREQSPIDKGKLYDAMSSVEAAQRRLEEALRRVEAALTRPRVQGEAGDGGGQSDASTLERARATLGAERDALASDVGALRHECGRLNEALDEAQRDNAALRRVNDEVARRLDGTIDELQQLLDA